MHPLDTAEMQLPDLTGDTKVKTEAKKDVTQRRKEGKLIQSKQGVKRRLKEKDITFINLVSDEKMEEEGTTGTQVAGTSMSAAERKDIDNDEDDDDKAEAKDHSDDGEDITNKDYHQDTDEEEEGSIAKSESKASRERKIWEQVAQESEESHGAKMEGDEVNEEEI